jgi:hypothetical protein
MDALGGFLGVRTGVHHPRMPFVLRMLLAITLAGFVLQNTCFRAIFLSKSTGLPAATLPGRGAEQSASKMRRASREIWTQGNARDADKKIGRKQRELFRDGGRWPAGILHAATDRSFQPRFSRRPDVSQYAKC